MVFSLDLDIFNQIIALSNQAYDELQSAEKFAKQVVEHNDWNCLERDKINENIQLLKNKMGLLHQEFDDYSRNLNLASQKFQEISNGWAYCMGDIDNAISNTIAIPTTAVNSETNILLEDVKSMISTSLDGNGFYSYQVNSLSDSIKVCEYPVIKNDN